MADAMQVGVRTVDGVRVRYAESDGPAAPSIVLTSPWTESVYAFAPLWSSPADVARLVAVDLPGFGRSERRRDLLSPRRWASSLCGSSLGEYASLIADWVAGGYRETAAVRRPP
jgi:pimeloyl-ACP methyl ester carboxylesterase